MLNELLTTKEAAEIAKVHVETIRRWIRRDQLPARYIPGRGRSKRELRISKMDLITFLDKQYSLKNK